MSFWTRRQTKHKCDFQKDVFLEYYHMNALKRRWLKFICVYDYNPGVSKYIPSSAKLDFEKRRQIDSKWWFVVHPFSLCRTIWESLMMIIFTLEELECVYFMTWRTNLYFTYSSDLFKFICMCNIFATFFTGYNDKVKEEIVLHPGKIASHYIRGLFVFEFIAAFPWTSLFIQYVVTEEDLARNSILNILSLTALFTIVYSVRLLKYSKHIMSYFSASVRSYRLYRITIIMIFIFHWLTCLECYPFTSTFGDEETRLKKEENLTNVDEYWQCCFRAMSFATKLSYGTVYSAHLSSLVPDLVCLTVGFVVFFFCLEEIILLDTTRTSPETKYQIQIQLLDEFMKQKEMPKRVQERLRSLYEYRFQKMFFRESIILSTLSPRLRQEINMHTCRHLVQESPLFRNVPRYIMAYIVNCLKYDIYLPNEVLIKAGSYGDCMFFLTTGTAAVITRTGHELAHVKDGSYFGEMEMVLENEHRTANVVALEFCEVYRLDRVVFQRIIRPFGNLYQEIQRVAWERMRTLMTIEGAYRRRARQTPNYLKMLAI